MKLIFLMTWQITVPIAGRVKVSPAFQAINFKRDFYCLRPQIRFFPQVLGLGTTLTQFLFNNVYLHIEIFVLREVSTLD